MDSPMEGTVHLRNQDRGCMEGRSLGGSVGETSLQVQCEPRPGWKTGGRHLALSRLWLTNDTMSGSMFICSFECIPISFAL